jgi:hypothetical protein
MIFWAALNPYFVAAGVSSFLTFHTTFFHAEHLHPPQCTHRYYESNSIFVVFNQIWQSTYFKQTYIKDCSKQSLQSFRFNSTMIELSVIWFCYIFIISPTESLFLLKWTNFFRDKLLSFFRVDTDSANRLFFSVFGHFFVFFMKQLFFAKELYWTRFL